MRRAALIAGVLGGATASLFALLMFYFSATGGFYLRNTLFEAIVLTLMGALGLAGAIRSSKNSRDGGWLMLLSVLVGIYYLWDVSEITMIIPTILLSAGTVLAFINAFSERN